MQKLISNSFPNLCKIMPEEKIEASYNIFFKNKAEEEALATFKKIEWLLEHDLDTEGYFSKTSTTFPIYLEKRRVFIIGSYAFAKGTIKKIKQAWYMNKCILCARIRVKGKNNIRCIDHEKNALNFLHFYKNSFIISKYLYESSIEKSGIRKKFLLQKMYFSDASALQQVPLMRKIFALIQMANCLAYMHEKFWVHLDAKPENFFLDGDLNSNKKDWIKIGDFGLSTQVGLPLRFSLTKERGYVYAAPEIHKDSEDEKRYITATTEMDCFTFGLTILQIIKGKYATENYPFYEDEEQGPLHIGVLNSKQWDLFFLDEIDFYETSSECKIIYKVIEIAKKLTDLDPLKRLNCKEASRQLTSLYELYKN